MTDKKYTIGVCFGAFDPIHHGHIKLLERAKERCAHLVVGLSTADYIEEFKGRKERVGFHERINALWSIEYVSNVLFQVDKDSKRKIIQTLIQIHGKDEVAIFVGDDWTPDTFTGDGLGVDVVYLPYTEGISSTQLVNKK